MSELSQKITPSIRSELDTLLANKAGQRFRRSDLSALLYRHTRPRSRPGADALADQVIRDAARQGLIIREGHQHWVRSPTYSGPASALPGGAASAKFSKAGMLTALQARADRIRGEHGFAVDNGTAQLKGKLASPNAAIAYGEFRTCLDLIQRIEDGSLLRA